MKRKSAIIVISPMVVAICLLAWAPWVTDDFAINRVVEKLGGPDATFNYLGENLPIKDIPKNVTWLPFGRFVTFPGEASWYVNLFGMIS